MAYLDKEAYLRKQLYAENRMAKNAEIETLTEEQHDALATICAIRHKIHASDYGEILYNSESANHEEWWRCISTSWGNNPIKELIKKTNLPEWDWKCDPDDYDIDFEYDNGICNEYNADRMEREEQVEPLYDLGNEWNISLEVYLRAIDEKHGTNYAPGGYTRLY